MFEPVDGRYYQAAAPKSLGERLMIIARDRIYADFLRRCRPEEAGSILDVGVSDVITDSANVLERNFPHPDRITAVGLGQGREFQTAFPLVRYSQIRPNAGLPFADGAFDIAVSNAVIEHVGSEENQVQFISELRRVAKLVFISAPNRYFPVEHHTAIPLLHFWPATFRAAGKVLRKEEWLDPENLILINRQRLQALGGPGSITGYTGLRLGPFSSNIYLVVQGSRSL